MERREFLRAGLALSALATACVANNDDDGIAQSESGLLGWDTVRDQFNLSRDQIDLAAFYLATHPRRVRNAISRHRTGLDYDPIAYKDANEDALIAGVLSAAASYLGVTTESLALTDSTTMGIGMLYGGLKLNTGQEIVTTEHDHYSTHTALELRARRTGTTVRKVRLYDNPATASVDRIVGTIVGAITSSTRVLALTWVHSNTGVKLPIRKIADALATINASRTSSDRVLLCVDGVHGLGVENVNLPDLGCDFFVAGTHKWMFGPRGTGIVWGRSSAWPWTRTFIPTFSGDAYAMWMNTVPDGDVPPPLLMTPGGFHSFEHRWALNEAFLFHRDDLGKARLQDRIRYLSHRIKDGLAAMSHVTLRTPRSDELSSGIVCFEVANRSAGSVVRSLWDNSRIRASVAPYPSPRYARVAGSVLTNSTEIDVFLAAVRAMA